MATPAITAKALARAGTPVIGWRAEIRRTVTLALPMVLTQLGQIAMNTTDAILVGRLGKEALAGVPLGSVAFFLFYFMCIGVVQATAPLAAQAYGARRPRIVRRVVRQGLWITLLLSVPSCLAIAFTEPALVALDQPADAAGPAGAYAGALLWGLPPAVGFMVLRNFLGALHRPSWALYIMMTAIPLNALLDVALIFGEWGAPALGIEGAGAATAIVNLLMFAALLSVAVFRRPFSRYAILGRFWRPDWSIFARIFRLGMPISALVILEFGVFAAALVMMGWISVAAVAAHQIALQVASITFMVPLGVSHAATVRVGNAAGRRDPAGARRAGWVSVLLGLAFTAMTSFAIWALAGVLPRAYLDPDVAANADVHQLAHTLLLIAALFQIADGLHVIGAGALRGLSDTKVPMGLAGAAFWLVGFGTAYALGFPLGAGAVGVWVGLAVGLATAAVLLLLRFWYLTRRDYLPPLPEGRHAAAL